LRTVNACRCAWRAGASLALIFAIAACGLKDKPIPAEPKARAEFLGAATAKVAPEDRALLDRFLARLDAQTASGAAAPALTIPRAIEIQRNYETQVADAQRNFRTLMGSAAADLAVRVRDATVVKADAARPAGEKALRYVIDVDNRGQRAIEQVALRVEIRDATGAYQAAIPNLELQGALRPGEAGRSVQTLPLDPQRHRYILAGGPVQISAYPTRIVYAGGERLDPGKELQAMESLHRAKIE
jgi:hypothetical protein